MVLLTRADLTKFQNFIESGDYDSAIGLADKFGLERDDVYKSQWIASDFGTEAIRNVLSRVEDGMWVVKECKERVCPSFESMNALILLGLKVTEPFVLPESGISSLEESDSDKAWWFRFKRLRLLQYKDRLDTFLGIRNGRYSQNEYKIFRSVPLLQVALRFAERGKTGDLSLLFKRHTYSLAPYIFQILDSIPESLPPQTYGQLLPGVTPPQPILPRRSEDWVETADILKELETCRRRVYHFENELHLQDSTENILKLSKGLVWPMKVEIVDWYKKRAKDIDISCGLLENSLSLLDVAIGKGWKELTTYFEDISDLCGVVFSSDSIDSQVHLTLSDWESLSKFEKFKVILDQASEETAIERLKERAVPYILRNQTLASPVINEAHRNNAEAAEDVNDDNSPPFLVQWLKETAKENKLSLCAIILAECCREQRDSGLFSSDEELVEVVLDCIYACTRTDEWTLMSSMLAKLPRSELRGKEPNMVIEDLQESRGLRKGFMKAFRGAVGGKSGELQLTMQSLALNVDDAQPTAPRSRDIRDNSLSGTLEGRIRQAEGHVEAGQLLSQYQVPKPICFFLVCKEDVSGTKQLVRIILLKFSNREPAKSDNGWALLWRDLRILQEKGFPFLEKEYLLSELCQGILKAGKFSLAKIYLKGTGTVILQTQKAEKLVLNAAREYFYSAPDLESPSIEKAKKCLNLLSPSEALTAEINLIDAITELLPSLGVTLLPVQFRQLKDSMEVVNMAISSHAGAYLNIAKIMDLARLLGLSSLADVMCIEAVIAREAAAAGDFGLARDLCLELVKKGHGPIWDLCAALGRGPDFEQMDLNTRKELIGFALGHCDEDSVGELLSAWKEFDLLSACNKLGRVVGRPSVSLAEHESKLVSLSERLEPQCDAVSSNDNGLEDLCWQGWRHALSFVSTEDGTAGEQSWKLFGKNKKKALGFVCFHLPWLLEVSSGKTQTKFEQDTHTEEGQVELGLWSHDLPKECQSLSAQASALVLHALATYDIVPNDTLVLRLAQEAMSRPVSKEGDMVGCGYLLNLHNAHFGTEVLEKEIETRENYQEAHQALEWALSFSMLQESVLDLQGAEERRDFLIQTLRDHKSTILDRSNQLGSDSNFWKEFSIGVVEKLRVAEESRRLQQMLPGVDLGRFLSGDEDYIREKIFSLVGSVRMQQEKWLPHVLTLANDYNVEEWQVLERHFLCLVGADWTSEKEILTEISGYCKRLLASSYRFPETLRLYERVVGTALEGLEKEGSVHGSVVSVYRRSLMRVLVSLSSEAASPIQEPFLSDLPEFNANEMLNRVRHSLWHKLCNFSEEPQASLPSRIFILELLDAIRNGRVPRKDFWRSCQLGDEEFVISWGKWEAKGGNLESLKQQEESGGHDKINIGSPVNVLLALRSTHIISTQWPGWEVTSADLTGPEAAASFFDRLVEVTSSVEQAKALKALLEEWESVFGPDNWQGDESKVTAVKGDEKEDWGEGWEDFSENSWTVNALHSCWKAVLQKLTELGDLRQALGVLDAALLHPTSVLVTEDEAKDLVAAIGLFNPSAALKLSLLLPYHSSQVHGLQLLEEKLKLMHKRSSGPMEQAKLSEGDEQEVNVGSMSQDGDSVNQDLLALVLSAGFLPSTAEDSSLTMLFSSLYAFLGHLALQLQELQLSMKPTINECLISVDNVPLCAVAFPFFVAELTKAKHYGQAGSMVLQFMRVHPALVTLDAACIGLQRFLSTQAYSASVEAIAKRFEGELRNQENCVLLGHLRNTVQSLTCRLEEVLKSASKVLSKDLE